MGSCVKSLRDIGYSRSTGNLLIYEEGSHLWEALDFHSCKYRCFYVCRSVFEVKAAPLIWSFTAHLIKCSQPIRWDETTVFLNSREIIRECSASGPFAFIFLFIYFVHLFCSSDLKTFKQILNITIMFFIRFQCSFKHELHACFNNDDDYILFLIII